MVSTAASLGPEVPPPSRSAEAPRRKLGELFGTPATRRARTSRTTCSRRPRGGPVRSATTHCAPNWTRPLPEAALHRAAETSSAHITGQLRGSSRSRPFPPRPTGTGCRHHARRWRVALGSADSPASRRWRCRRSRCSTCAVARRAGVEAEAAEPRNRLDDRWSPPGCRRCRNRWTPVTSAPVCVRGSHVGSLWGRCPLDRRTVAVCGDLVVPPFPQGGQGPLLGGVRRLLSAAVLGGAGSA